MRAQAGARCGNAQQYSALGVAQGSDEGGGKTRRRGCGGRHRQGWGCPACLEHFVRGLEGAPRALVRVLFLPHLGLLLHVHLGGRGGGNNINVMLPTVSLLSDGDGNVCQTAFFG